MGKVIYLGVDSCVVACSISTYQDFLVLVFSFHCVFRQAWTQ